MKQKLLLSLLMLLTAKGVWAYVRINETNFPDENFRNYLLQQSYGKDGVLTYEEIASVESLLVDGKKIKSLKGIEYFTELTMLFCSRNQLTSLDVSENTELEYLNCQENQLTSINVSGNTELEDLHCSRNQLTSIDVSKNTRLWHLSCEKNQLTALDVSKHTRLSKLW